MNCWMEMVFAFLLGRMRRLDAVLCFGATLIRMVGFIWIVDLIIVGKCDFDEKIIIILLNGCLICIEFLLKNVIVDRSKLFLKYYMKNFDHSFI